MKHGYWLFYSRIADNLNHEPDIFSTAIWYPYMRSNLVIEPNTYVSGTTYYQGDCCRGSDGLNYVCVAESTTIPPYYTWPPYPWEQYFIGETANHWSSFPPYGGVGKSPKYFVVTFEATYNDLNGPARVQTIKGKVVVALVELGPPLSCAYNGVGTAVFTDSDAGSFVFTVSASYAVCGGTGSIHITDKGGYTGDVYLQIVRFTISTYCNFEKTEGYLDERADARYWSTMSARPLDCNYVQYSGSVVYQAGDCVYYGGRFWKCIAENGPGTANGIQEPQDSSMCWESA